PFCYASLVNTCGHPLSVASFEEPLAECVACRAGRAAAHHGGKGRRLDPGLAQTLRKPPAQREQDALCGRVYGGLDHWERETSAPRRERDAWNGSRQVRRYG